MATRYTKRETSSREGVVRGAGGNSLARVVRKAGARAGAEAEAGAEEEAGDRRAGDGEGAGE